jgi:hypothetical protein
MLNRNIFVVKLIEKPKGRGVLRTRSKSRLAEFLGDDLNLVYKLVQSNLKFGARDTCIKLFNIPYGRRIEVYICVPIYDRIDLVV